jgi:hypothetical protein
MPKIGEPNGPKPGRQKGAINKNSALLKEAILKASELAGEDGRGKGATVGYLKRLAIDHPPAFAQLLGKVIPLQVTGEDGGPIRVGVVEWRVVRPEPKS